MNVIEEFESREMAKREVQFPEFSSGDTVKVSVNVIEGERKRVQAFEGVVLGRRNRGLNSSFIVRKIFWNRSRKDFSTFLSLDFEDRGHPKGRCASVQIILLARKIRKVGQDQRKTTWKIKG